MGLFDVNHYIIRRRILAIFGNQVDFLNDNGICVGFGHKELLKLKELITLYTTPAKAKVLATIKAQNVIDFSGSYDIISGDGATSYGTWSRHGLTSMLRDSWSCGSAKGDRYTLQEDSQNMALLRRFIINIIPQTYYLKKNGMNIATIKQNFNPFVRKLEVDIPYNIEQEERLIVASAGLLLMFIEGRQNQH